MGKKERFIRKKNGQIMRNPPEGINGYKTGILAEGRSINIGGEHYKARKVTSPRLTRLHGHLIEKEVDKKGVFTGKLIEHMRSALQIVKV